VENGDGPPSRARQGRARAADGLSTRASLIACSRNCQPASPPGLQPHPLVRGARSPSLLAPQTARCACSRHKNVRRPQVYSRTEMCVAPRSTAAHFCAENSRTLELNVKYVHGKSIIVFGVAGCRCILIECLSSSLCAFLTPSP
jgi:hypothetical protein